MIGQILINRYDIQVALGQQAGRQMLLAWDQQTQQSVVIKLLSFNPNFEWQDLRLFQREAETLRALHHSAIPRYLDSFDVSLPQAKGFALVQSYVEGQSLAELLKAGRTFPDSEVIQLAARLLEILVYLQAQQPPVIHRDIKPGNILLAPDGQVYLIDFGSVQTLAAHESGTITIVGSYGYMPPEQFGGRAVPASDLYGLGATLIYLITGKHPAEIPQRQLKLQFEPLTRMSPAFTRWLACLIAPGLDERFASAEAALQQLNRLFTTPSPVIAAASETVAAALVITRPSHSQITLEKTDQALTISFPDSLISSPAPRRMQPLENLPALIMASIVLVVIEPALLLLSGGLLLAWVCQPKVFAADKPQPLKNTLSLTAEYLTWSCHDETDKQSTQTIPRSAITGVIYESTDHTAKLIIQSEHPHHIHSSETVSFKDLQWLAAVLSQALDLPVTQTRAHPPLPTALFRQGDPKLLSPSAAVEKPDNSQIVVLKQPTWLEILYPVRAETEAYNRLYIDNQQIRQARPFRGDPTPGLRIAIANTQSLTIGFTNSGRSSWGQ